MAKESGSPSFLACSTRSLMALGSAPTLPFHSLLRVIAWPLRLSNQGMIIGFFGEPSRPMVEAIGMPVSMWVAWISPLESESRMAAQLAPLLTTELRPYFLNSPFSWAMTMGEQSVKAIIPKRTPGVSGASLAYTEPAQPPGNPLIKAAAPSPLAVARRNWRRFSGSAAGSVWIGFRFIFTPLPAKQPKHQNKHTGHEFR